MILKMIITCSFMIITWSSNNYYMIITWFPKWLLHDYYTHKFCFNATHLMFPALVCHSQGVVGELIWLTLLGLNHEPVWPWPVLSINNRLQLPQLIGSVYHHQILRLLVSHMGAKMLDFLEGWHTGAHACQCQFQWTGTLYTTLQLLQIPTKYTSLLDHKIFLAKTDCYTCWKS